MQVDIVAKIENRLAENKSSIKTYSSFERARKAGLHYATRAIPHFASDLDASPCSFIVVYLPGADRFSVIFMLTEYMAFHKCGGYIGYFSQLGFMSI